MSSVQSVDRAFAILEALADSAAGISELADATKLPKSTVSRLVGTLEQRGAVERSPGETRYRLGPGIADLASAISPSRHLIAVARPHLEELTAAVGEASGLSVPDGYDVLYLVQVEAPNPVQVRDWTGSRIPMHSVPSGLVLMAHWPAESIASYLNRELDRPTRHTVTEPDGIRAKLADARRLDHAWVFEEFAEGINSVATPIRHGGAVVAALHIHGPAYRFPEGGSRSAITAHLIAAGRKITADL